MRKRFLGVLVGVTLAVTGCLADASNTGPPPEEDVCDTTTTGEFVIDTDNTVVDGLCLTDGFVHIRADNVTLRNSKITGAPALAFWIPVLVAPGSDNAEVHNNVIDCGPADTGTPIASQGIRSPDGLTSGDAHNNEIRDCTDAIEVASNWTYSFNWIHSPDNTDDAHADGFQFSTESDGTGIHDVLVEWNTVEFPDSSASFQYYNNPSTGPGSWPARITVRYNAFNGGAAVVRFPGRNCLPSVCGGVDLEFYGNRLRRLTAGEFILCDGDSDTIEVWGSETGDTTDSLPPGAPDGVVDDENINAETGVVLERADCNENP